MRLALPFLLLLTPLATAQSTDEVKATLAFISKLRDPATGAYAVHPPKEGEKLTPSLRAVNGAVKATKYLGGEVTDQDKLKKFVLSCYNDKTGTFAEPGGKPDVTITSVGVMAAVELGIPKESYRKAMDYLKANAKTFEEVRIAAAAVEAFGLKDSGIDLKVWERFGIDALASSSDAKADARLSGSAVALILRLEPNPETRAAKLVQAELRLLNHKVLHVGQRKDGGWAKKGALESDAETTYRVMRALKLMNERPTDIPALKTFLVSCRRPDGGYGVDAKAPSSMSGVYYYAAVSKWLSEMEKQ